jgi:hypothetical protein
VAPGEADEAMPTPVMPSGGYPGVHVYGTRPTCLCRLSQMSAPRLGGQLAVAFAMVRACFSSPAVPNCQHARGETSLPKLRAHAPVDHDGLRHHGEIL